MNFAFIVGKFPSLSETFILNQITGLIDAGHKVDIFASKPEKEIKTHPLVKEYDLLSSVSYYPRIPGRHELRFLKACFLIPYLFLKNPSLLYRALQEVNVDRQPLFLSLLFVMAPFLDKQPQYDVVLCHFGHVGLLGMQLRKIGAIQGKLCTIFHAWDITTYINSTHPTVYQDLFRDGDILLPISHHWQRRLIELGCSPDKVIVHPMGIDCGQFQFLERTLDNGEPVQFISVARLVEKKGIEYAIRAIKLAREQCKNMTYRVIGDGPLRPKLEQLIKALNLQDSVELLGWMNQDEVVAELGRSHIFLAPSVTCGNGDQEGIPVAIMEAMAMGMPVISTHHSGIPELVDDGTSGFLVPERDPEALAVKLVQLAKHPDLWIEMGKAGRQKVEADFNIEQLNRKLAQICEQQLG